MSYGLNGRKFISGNDKADKAAKSALNKPILRIPVPYTDLKPIITTCIMVF